MSSEQSTEARFQRAFGQMVKRELLDRQDIVSEIPLDKSAGRRRGGYGVLDSLIITQGIRARVLIYPAAFNCWAEAEKRFGRMSDVRAH
jgi:hypothetical protein